MSTTPSPSLDLIIAANTCFAEKPNHQQAIVDIFSSLSEFLSQLDAYLGQTQLGPDYQSLVRRRAAALDVSTVHAQLAKHKAKIITQWDDHYPEIFHELSDPPVCLYAKGNSEYLLQLAARPGLAVVGPRQCSDYGKEVTQYLTQSVCEQVMIISGLAAGIDTIAHQTALECGQPTIAIIGCGFDFIYPKENERLYHAIEANGLLLTEFPFSTPPHPTNFPQRNRLVSGLSQGVLVTEAELKSGSLITARFAMEQNRDVLAVPGSIFSKTSHGVHKLIQDGAKCITHPDDILEEFNIHHRHEKGRRQPVIQPSAEPTIPLDDLTQQEAALLQLIPHASSVTLDELTLKTDMPILTIMQTLTLLELNGHVEALPGQAYQRT